MNFDNLAEALMAEVHEAGAGKAKVVYESEDGKPLAFVYVCIEPELSELLVPAIDEIEKKYDEEEE